MDDISKFLSLPWATLLALAAGYSAYFTANAGVRGYQNTTDVIFSTLVFGFFGAFAYQYAYTIWQLGILISSIVGYLAAMIIGAFWATYGRDGYYWILRKTKISLHYDRPSAWLLLFENKKLPFTQLTVRLKDGTWLHCEKLANFKHKRGGACAFGAQGDITMYVTHIKYASSQAYQPRVNVEDTDWGDEITYVPAEQIDRVIVRRKVAS
ncbi:hypothetical protein FHT86_007056 [Rhizobium sp. BK313]|uniref:hypothetical protein n=1 Tax=Rhizobium sp. BK313 TaxID=2587081 RepID=UPI00105D2895|nr:hypothetical protein [Rhizobium sp. BK313]MBB3458730.1 hypothetical protein [Rhizobium sp. BK313]